MSAIRGLEPLVNLARLQIRAGQTDDGRQRLLDLYESVGTGSPAVFENITVPAHLAASPEDRRKSTRGCGVWCSLTAPAR